MERDWQAARRELQQALSSSNLSTQTAVDSTRLWNSTSAAATTMLSASALHQSGLGVSLGGHDENRSLLGQTLLGGQSFSNVLQQSAVLSQQLSAQQAPSVVVRPSRREQRFLEGVSRWAASDRERLQNAPLVSRLTEAAEEMRGAEEGQSAEEAAHMWRLLRAQAQAPRNEPALLDAAQSFLSTQYADIIAAAVRSAGALDASLAGAPGLLATIQRYVLQRHPQATGERDEQGCAVWPVVYYAMRCGQEATAVEYARRCGIADLQSAAGAAQRQPQSMQSAQQPNFRLAVAALHGGSESAGRDSGVFKTTEDYLWLRLRLVRSKNQTLESLQSTVHKYSNGFRDRPALMALMHMLTLEFDRAVTALLVPSHALFVDGVHCALALVQGGFSTQVPDPAIRYVVSRVVPWDTSAALDYCRAAPVPALLEAVLLGCASSPTLAALLKGLPQAVEDATLRLNLLQRCGRQCADAGRPNDACLLFEAAGEWDAVLSVLLAHCSRLVTARGHHTAPVMLLAKEYAARWSDSGQWRHMRDQRAVEAFRHLFALSDFFTAFHEGNFLAALDIARRSLPMLPLGQGHDACMRVIEALHESVVGVLPDTFLATMTMLAKLYGAARTTAPTAGVGAGAAGQGGLPEARRLYKKQAQDLLSFAGLLQTRLSSDVFARLVALSSSMT